MWAYSLFDFILDIIPERTKDFYIGLFVVFKLKELLGDRFDQVFMDGFIKRGQCIALNILQDEHDAWDIAFDIATLLLGRQVKQLYKNS